MQKHLTALLTKYGIKSPPQQFKTHVSKGTKDARGEAGVYVGLNETDNIVGEVRIAKGWNPIGHEVSDALGARCRLLTNFRESIT